MPFIINGCGYVLIKGIAAILVFTVPDALVFIKDKFA